MPPYNEDSEQARPYFRQMREARDVVLAKLDDVFEPARAGQVEGWHLSMGMSNDFEVAIEEGATMVRIGTQLFGARS